jgi:hypothetical protein
MRHRFGFILPATALALTLAVPAAAQTPGNAGGQGAAASPAQAAPPPPPALLAPPVIETQGGGMNDQELARRVHSPLISVGGAATKPSPKPNVSGSGVQQPF